MSTQDPLSLTQILAAASSALERFQFTEVTRVLPGVDAGHHRLFEDSYCIVAVVVFQDWEELRTGWIDVQSAFVELMSQHIPKDAPKSWDGYLALLTPGLVPSNNEEVVSHIRYDTGRVRKLIATGGMLTEVSDVESALLPLLPLQEDETGATGEGVLSRLPDLLATDRLPRDLIKTVVDAFVAQEPLVESLHIFRSGK